MKSLTEKFGVKDIICSRNIRRNRNIIKRSDSKQSFDIGIMRLSLKWIPEEDDAMRIQGISFFTARDGNCTNWEQNR